MHGKGDSLTQRSARGKKSDRKRRLWSLPYFISFRLPTAPHVPELSLLVSCIRLCVIWGKGFFSVQFLHNSHCNSFLIVTVGVRLRTVTILPVVIIILFSSLSFKLGLIWVQLFLLSYFFKKLIPGKVALFLFAPHRQITWSDRQPASPIPRRTQDPVNLL